MWLMSQEKGCKDTLEAFYLLSDIGTGYWFPMQIQAWERKDWMQGS